MSVEHYLEELRGEDGHDVVHLVQPLDQTRLRVEEQLVPELHLVESEHVHIDVGELGDCEVHQPSDQGVCLLCSSHAVVKWFPLMPVPSLRLQAVARISHSPTTAWPAH